jgi:hypothetical protein
MFTPELLSLVGGGAAGFLFRYMAQKSQDQKSYGGVISTDRTEPFDESGRLITLFPGSGHLRILYSNFVG